MNLTEFGNRVSNISNEKNLLIQKLIENKFDVKEIFVLNNSCITFSQKYKSFMSDLCKLFEMSATLDIEFLDSNWSEKESFIAYDDFREGVQDNINIKNMDKNDNVYIGIHIYTGCDCNYSHNLVCDIIEKQFEQYITCSNYDYEGYDNLSRGTEYYAFFKLNVEEIKYFLN